MRDQRGAATVEWTGLVLAVALGLGAIGAVAPVVDGRSLGALISHALVCAVRVGCADGDEALVAAYGERRAALVRRHAPGLVYERGERQLPVDYRDCRDPECAAAPDDPDLDAHRTTAGHTATAFTHMVRREDETFVQYWLYYPDSNTAVLGSDNAWPYLGPLVHLGGRVVTGRWGYPGYHRDDWESYQVRIAADGRASVRASSHGGYQWCKQSECRNVWGDSTGWTRVSRGSHAGHIPLRARLEGVSLAPGTYPPLELRHSFSPQYPGTDLRERTTTAAGLRLVPLERLDHGRYEPVDHGVSPPWRKEVYRRPLSDATG